MSILLLFGLLAAAWVYQALAPLDSEGKARVFEVKEGATLKQVAVDLETAGLIKSSTLFHLSGRLKGYGQRIKTGEYRLNSAMSPSKILEILEKGRSITYFVTIPEGFNLYPDCRSAGAKGSGGQASLFIEQADGQIPHGERLGLSGETLEGYLYPDTYRFRRQ